MKRLVLLVILIAGCGTTDSGSLLTSGMSAEMSAVTQGNGSTVVTVELFSGNPDQLIFVDLTGDDQLIAKHGSDSQVMTETQLVTIVAHEATFPVGGEGEMFTVDFQRTIDDGAPMSTMTLPASFTLGTVPASASRAADLTITWSPGSLDPITWRVEGTCIDTAIGNLTSDTGTLTIPANTVQKVQAQNVPDTCQATLTIDRVHPGQLDTHFGKGGQAQGVQERTATFTTTL